MNHGDAFHILTRWCSCHSMGVF